MAQRIKFKGAAARAVDAWYSSGSVADNLTEARNLLRSPRDFTAIIAALTHGSPEFVYPHSSVLVGSHFERVAREGYLEAIARALGHSPPVPISTFWETGAGNADFEFAIADRVDHVEVTFRVPGVEVDPAKERGLTDVQKEN